MAWFMKKTNHLFFVFDLISPGRKKNGYRLPSPDHSFPSPDHRLLSPDDRLPSPDHSLPSPDHRLLSTGLNDRRCPPTQQTIPTWLLVQVIEP